MDETAKFPVAFAEAVKSIKSVEFRHDLSLKEIDSPQGIAPWSFALAADILPDPHEGHTLHGTGRFILLYDPEEPSAWGGSFRIVSFAQAPLESEIGLDPFLAQVSWSWLEDALQARKAKYLNASGTATRILSTGFGQLEEQGDGAQIELRASWTPASTDMSSQVTAWADLVCLLSGLPPSSEATSLTAKRRERG